MGHNCYFDPGNNGQPLSQDSCQVLTANICHFSVLEIIHTLFPPEQLEICSQLLAVVTLLCYGALITSGFILLPLILSSSASGDNYFTLCLCKTNMLSFYTKSMQCLPSLPSLLPLLWCPRCSSTC